MGCFRICQEAAADVTVISNVFIDSYMKEANDAQLKLYLYLLRMVEANCSTSVSDMADQFNYTEKDVLRALKYWEKNHLLVLEYEDGKSLSGIRLLKLPQKDRKEVSPLAPLVALPPKNGSSQETSPFKEETSPQETAFSKPSYSLDELKEFKEKEETSQLLFVAEQYIGKPLSPGEITTLLFFSDRLGFSEDLIDYLIQYCVDKGKKDFRYIEKVAISWAQQGITTPKEASRLAGKYDRIVYTVMKALGKSGTPTRAEADFAMKWWKEYGFTQDIIMEACERTVLATDRHRFEYADSILSRWHREQVHHRADITALDESHAKARAQKSVPKASAGSSVFNQFMHTDYDFEELEKEILSN